MAAVLLIARSRLRANLTATVLLVLLAGLGGGVVMASVAGIRRAEGAWARLQTARTRTPTRAVVFLGSDGEPIEGEQAEEIEALATLPEVAVAARASAVIGVLRDRRGQNWPVAANAYLDAPHPALVGRPSPRRGERCRFRPPQTRPRSTSRWPTRSGRRSEIECRSPRSGPTSSRLPATAVTPNPPARPPRCWSPASSDSRATSSRPARTNTPCTPTSRTCCSRRGGGRRTDPTSATTASS